MSHAARALEDELIAMVATLPALPHERMRELAAAAAALADDAVLPAQGLARALAAVLGRYADGAAPLEGWGLVVQAADTLARALEQPGAISATGLAAASYELDSLAAPSGAAPAAPATPDVPLTSLRRRT